MKLLKSLVKVFLTLLTTLIFIWIVLIALFSTRQGQKWVVEKGLAYLEKQTETTIQTEIFEYTFPFHLHVEGLSISRQAQPILSIEKFNIACEYWQLLKGKFVISFLKAENILLQNLLDIYESPKNENSSSEVNFKTFPFPLYVKVENIDLRSISIAPTVFKQLNLSANIIEQADDLKFSIKGMLKNNPFKNLFSTHAILEITNNNYLPLPLVVNLDIDNNHLTSNFNYDHFTYPLQLSNEVIPLDMKINFMASLNDWQKTIQNPKQQGNKINGSYQIIALLPETDSFYKNLLGKELQLEGKFSFKKNHLLLLSEIQLNSQTFIFNGQAAIDKNFYIRESLFNGTILDLEKFSFLSNKNIKGLLTFEGSILGSRNKPQIIFEGSSPEVKLENYSFKNVHISSKTHLENRHMIGRIGLEFEHLNQNCNLNSNFSIDDQLLTLSDLSVKALDSFAEGDLTLNLLNLITEGHLDIHFTNLENFSNFFNLPSMKGNGLAQIKLKPALDINDNKQQAIDAKLNGYQLDMNDHQIDELSYQAKFYPSLEKQNFYVLQSEIEAEKLQSTDYSISNISVNTTQNINVDTYSVFDLSTQIHLDKISSIRGEAQSGQIYFFLKDPFTNPQGEVNVSLERIQTEATTFNHLNAITTLNSLEKKNPFQIYVQGNSQVEWNAEANGFWSFQNGLNCALEKLEGIYGTQPLKLQNPLWISYQKGNVSLADLKFSFGKAEIEAQFQKINKEIIFDFRTNDISTTLIKYFYPDLPITGKASFEGHLGGTIDQPEGSLLIYLRNMQITEEIFAQNPLVQGNIQLDLNGSGINLKSTLNGIGSSPVHAQGTLPIAFSLSPISMVIQKDNPFSVTLEARGEIGPYMHLFYNDTSNLTGQVKIAINLSGQIDNPQIKGSIKLTDGAYEILKSGSIYHNIQAILEGDGSVVVIKHFSAENSKHGSITAKGKISLDKKQHFPFDIKLEPKQIAIMESDYADIEASGSLQLVGNLKKSKLRGDLTVDNAVIHMEEALPKQIKSVAVIFINQNPDHKSKRSSEVSNSSPLAFDIKLQIPGNVSIEGNNLSSEWKGAITITGTANNPLLNGDLSVINGQYDFNGKTFNLSQGNIHFAGSPGKKTSIYVVASKEIDRIRADIIVKGAADKLVVSFRSNPPLSQREVLSYILFNRGIADITPDQGDQLSQSFISLNASEQNSSSDDFLTKIRNNIGIDRLDISANDNNNKDLSLQIGKYITEGVFVSINKSISDIGNRLAIEANVHKNLKAQAEVELGTANQGKISLKWKNDY